VTVKRVRRPSMTIASAPFCVGITAAAAASYPTTTIAGHEMVEIPGGHFVMESGWFGNSNPSWVSLSPYLMAETATTWSQYHEVIGRTRRGNHWRNHPVTVVTYDRAMDYLERRGGRLTLPTYAQWENAARGPAVNIAELMESETGRFTPADVVDFIEGRFENLVFKVLGQIYTDPRSEKFQKLIKRGRPFFGWRVYGTPSGRLSHESAWFEQKQTTLVNWGPKNAYGLYNMTGNVNEWILGRYSRDEYLPSGMDPEAPTEGEFRLCRGGDYHADNEFWRYLSSERGSLQINSGRWGKLQINYRIYYEPQTRGEGTGFRAAAPVTA